MTEKGRVHIFVSGRVQGVFFRENTRRLAKSLGIKGWVRNLADGRVKAVFEGEKESLQKMVDWAKKGPALARVNGVEISWEKYQAEFIDFEIRYD
jgi:acylphosphatase